MRCAAAARLAALATLAAVVPASPARAAAAPVLAAAGDISCHPAAGPFVAYVRCGQGATARLVQAANPAVVAVLGDIQYQASLPEEFAAPGRFTDTWGAFRAKIRPVPGNHEYAEHAGTAASYFDYFNGAGRMSGPAGNRALGGYYSYEVGTWHVVALNSNCSDFAPSAVPPSGTCTNEPAGSTWQAQTQWLKADLAANRGRCVLAYWHHPLFTSGVPDDGVPPSPAVRPLFQALYEARADIVLNGHAHNYERFAPQNPVGTPDPAGVRQFVVGTGGVDLLAFDAPLPASEVRAHGDFGVLLLTLRPGSYAWRFQQVNDPGRDSGSGTCHARPVPAAADARAALRGLRHAVRGVRLPALAGAGRVRFAFRPALAGRLTLVARAGAVPVARAAAAVAAGTSASVTLRLTAAGRRLLRARPSVLLSTTATVARDGARAQSARVRLRLRR
ncbi:MAG TPA: metallophosphoesterase [Solirubrobacteraceae bacterium]|nr:metallophosphoesterase [Solirubrobacteraceae bacterium]